MRKWHRWLSVFFGLFMIVMAVTGLTIHANDLLKDDDRPTTAAPARADGFVCPPDMMCRPKPKRGQGLNFAGLVKHIHSGEIAGPVGTTVSILTGLALLFFSVSGLWMYIQLWTNRKSRGLTPKWFWK
ncbi:MAG: PepSY domain-containing protein [Sphingomonadales bacterium]|nr:PepSY domain-containing protein [Sphingomonadales bacterium]